MELNLTKVIEQVSKDKGLDKKVLVEALEEAVLTAAKKKWEKKELEAHYNEEVGEIELFEFKKVVKKIKDPEIEIDLKGAKELDGGAAVGDSLGVKVPKQELGRITAQTAKQVIIAKVRDAERDMTYAEYIDRKGELINGIFRRYDKKDIIIDLGKAEACLPEREQIPNERFRSGDRVQAYIQDVKGAGKGHQIIMSRACPEFLVKLFEMEVPEIFEGVVKIKSAAREPGDRSKIAVHSEDSDVDPVGACVGIKGSRVQNIVSELRGEKIDIVAWDEDSAKYVCNALAPADVQKVIIDNEQNLIEVIVSDDQLSLAIGKKGQNVRLAAQIMGWKIDIDSESNVKKKAERAKGLLAQVSELDDSGCELLIKQGYITAKDLRSLTADLLKEILALSPKKAEAIIEGMQDVITNLEKLEKTEDVKPPKPVKKEEKEIKEEPKKEVSEEKKEEVVIKEEIGEDKVEEKKEEKTEEEPNKDAVEEKKEEVVVKEETEEEAVEEKDTTEQNITEVKEEKETNNK